MLDKSPIPVETLRQLLRYEPETGRLFWLQRPPGVSATERARIIFNKRFAGKEALTAMCNQGYRSGSVLCNKMKAHRVAMALHYGVWPDGHVDHINHDRSDNRIQNLRSVSPLENQRNQRKSKANTSGVTGVYWDKFNNKWVVRLRANGSQLNLGRFDDFEEAVAARKKAERQHGYHPNHGV